METTVYCQKFHANRQGRNMNDDMVARIDKMKVRLDEMRGYL